MTWQRVLIGLAIWLAVGLAIGPVVGWWLSKCNPWDDEDDQ